MANSYINGNNDSDAVTVTNATDGSGTPSQNPNDVTVVTSNATVSGSGAYFNVDFYGGADLLLAQNVPWVNPSSGSSVGFDQVDMGSGDDTVELDRSAFRDIDMGTGDDRLALLNSGGRSAEMGGGDDFAHLDLSDALGSSEEELAQKDNQPLLDLDGGADEDTLNLVGEWTVTLTSGNVTIDPGNDGIDTTVTNIFEASDYGDITGMPALLNGSVQWSDPVTLSGGEEVHPAIAFSNFEVLDAVCYTAGTLIDTPQGPCDIAEMQEGDLVCTRDGPLPIRWIGKRRFDLVDLMANPKLLPIRVPAHALGPNRPNVDLLVSPQHRVVIHSRIAKRMFGSNEVLVAAKQLVGLNGIDIKGEVREVVYMHFMLDAHAIVIANGLEAETLLPGPQALQMMPRKARDELLMIFPEILDVLANPSEHAVLPILKGRDGRALAARLKKNFTIVS